MIVIDWKSPETHRNFNIAFESSNQKIIEKFYTFDKGFNLKNTLLEKIDISNRLKKFLYVKKLLKTHKEKKILFLTYDPFFIAFLEGHFFTYEHNSVPEKIFSRHGIFQFCFYRKLTRLCQNNQQVHQISRLKGHGVMVGCPLEKTIRPTALARRKQIFIGSQRCLSEDFSLLRNYFFGYHFLFKKGTFVDEHLIDVSSPDITCKNWINFEDIDQCSFIAVLINDNFRPSGWFGESITRHIPLAIMYSNAKSMFSSTFPNAPYVNICQNQQFSNHKDNQEFDYDKYIDQNNLDFGNTLKKLTDKYCR